MLQELFWHEQPSPSDTEVPQCLRRRYLLAMKRVRRPRLAGFSGLASDLLSLFVCLGEKVVGIEKHWLFQWWVFVSSQMRFFQQQTLGSTGVLLLCAPRKYRVTVGCHSPAQ